MNGAFTPGSCGPAQHAGLAPWGASSRITRFRMIRPALAAATLFAAASSALPAAALAQTAPAPAPAPAPAASAPATAPMGMAEILELLRQRGYSDIREIERKGAALYEVDARDPAGRSVELVIDARSGEILRSKRDY